LQRVDQVAPDVMPLEAALELNKAAVALMKYLPRHQAKINANAAQYFPSGAYAAQG
jgi:hypothetical protein